MSLRSRNAQEGNSRLCNTQGEIDCRNECFAREKCADNDEGCKHRCRKECCIWDEAEGSVGAEEAEEMEKEEEADVNFGCVWPDIVDTAGVTFYYEILTTDSDGVDMQEEVDRLNVFIPLETQNALNVRDCEPSPSRQLEFKLLKSRELAESGILKVGVGENDTIDETGMCTSFQISFYNLSCTPMKGHVKILFDPNITNSTEASATTLNGIADAMANDRLLTDKLVGVNFVERKKLGSAGSTIVREGPQGDNGMTAGGIAGLAIGLAALVMLVTALILRRARKQQGDKADQTDENFDTQKCSQDGRQEMQNGSNGSITNANGDPQKCTDGEKQEMQKELNDVVANIDKAVIKEVQDDVGKNGRRFDCGFELCLK